MLSFNFFFFLLEIILIFFAFLLDWNFSFFLFLFPFYFQSIYFILLSFSHRVISFSLTFLLTSLSIPVRFWGRRLFGFLFGFLSHILELSFDLLNFNYFGN